MVHGNKFNLILAAACPVGDKAYRKKRRLSILPQFSLEFLRILVNILIFFVPRAAALGTEKHLLQVISPPS